MTKVTLLGDSIRQIGYGPKVPALLGDEFTVWQPGENCRFAQYTLRGMWDWAADMEGSEIVHWNNGLWDICNIFGDGLFTPLDVYVDFMVRTAKILQKRHGKVIFATTTPVTKQNVHNSNAEIIRYNQTIVPVLADMGIIINDLHSLMYADIDRFIRKDDNIHLTEEGADVCARQVADMILAAAKN